MKPTPLKITAQSTRLPNGKAEPREAVLMLDLLHNQDGAKAGAVRLEGGSTGYESFYVSHDLSELEEAARVGWLACAGTPGSWPSCFVPAAEMRRALALFRAMQSLFAAEPSDTADVYVASDESTAHGRTVVCALLHFDGYWRAFTTTEENLSGAALHLKVARFAVEHMRTRLRLRVVTHSEELRAAFAGELPVDEESRPERSLLEAELGHHRLDSVTAQPAHPLVDACARVAAEAQVFGNDFERACALRLRRSKLERTAVILLAGHEASTARPVVTVYVSSADDEAGRRTAMMALLNCGERWKAVGWLSDERIDPALAHAHVLAYALDHLTEPCYVRVVGDEARAALEYEDDGARARTIRSRAIWEALDDGLATHPLLAWDVSPENTLVRACLQGARMVAAARTVKVAAAEAQVASSAPRLAHAAAAAPVTLSLVTEIGKLFAPREPVAGSRGRYAYVPDGGCATRAELGDETLFEHVETFYQDAGRELGHIILRRRADSALFEISDWATATVGYQVVATGVSSPVAFGYRCQECGEGTVKEQVFPEYFTKIKGTPVSIKGARVGVCDRCEAQHFDPNETIRWRTLPETLAALAWETAVAV